MVIVSHLCLQESFLLPGSTMNATLNLLNIAEEVISEKGPYHSNLLTLFEHYGATMSDDDEGGDDENDENDSDVNDESDNDLSSEQQQEQEQQAVENESFDQNGENGENADSNEQMTSSNYYDSSSVNGGSGSSWWSSIFGVFSSSSSSTNTTTATNGPISSPSSSSTFSSINRHHHHHDASNDNLSSCSSSTATTTTTTTTTARAHRRRRQSQTTVIVNDSKLNWRIDRVYGQIYGMCIADSTWLNSIVDCERENRKYRHYHQHQNHQHQNDMDVKNGDNDGGGDSGGDSGGGDNNDWTLVNDDTVDVNTFNDDHMYPYENHLKSLVPRKKNSQVIFMSHPREFDQCGHQTIFLNDHRKFDFSLVLPTSEIPPTYKGTLIRYIYFLALSIQVSNPKKGVYTKVMTIPFKIRNPVASLASVNSRFSERFDFQWKLLDTTGVMLSNTDMDRGDNGRNRNRQATKRSMLSDHRNSDNNTIRRNTPTVATESSRSDLSTSSFYYSFRAIDNIISNQSRANYYEITDASDRGVCKFSLSNTALCIGDTLLGVFDFSQCQVPCLKVNIELIYEEAYAKWLHKGYITTQQRQQQQDSDHSNQVEETGIAKREEYYQSLESRLCRSSVANVSRHTLNTLTTDFHMMIPPQSPAQFSTDMINVKWYLKFTFYLLNNSSGNQQQQKWVYSTQMLHEQRNSLSVDVLEWQLPIQVFVPTHFRPLHTQSMSRDICMLCYHV